MKIFVLLFQLCAASAAPTVFVSFMCLHKTMQVLHQHRPAQLLSTTLIIDESHP